MRTATRLVSVLVVLSAAACGGGDDASSVPDANTIDAAVAPAFRNPVDLPDDQLALQALQLIGANVPDADFNCNACHSITKSRLRAWEALSDASMANCLTDLEVTDQATAAVMTECLRENPTDPTTPFSPGVIGFYATAADLDWFTYLFNLSYGVDGETMHDDFTGRVLMPRGDHPAFTQGEFDIIAEWVARDLVLLDDLLDDEVLPGDCTTSITTALTDYVGLMATTGWKSVNAPTLNMYGCAGAVPVRDCMADQTLASTTVFGANWEDDLPGSKFRILRTNNYTSAYWTRSSPDGRFVAHGGNDDSQDGNPSGTNYESTIIDLNDDHLIHTTALYDPGFFPDNSGWMFQGSSGRICPMSVLTGTPAPTNFLYSANTPPCISTSQIGLYQHMGAALGGGDHWTLDGNFESDSGGHQPTIGDVDASFTASAHMDFTALEFNGTSYTVGQTESLTTPNEGDAEMSPSTGILVSRVAGTGGVQNGYRVRRFIPTPDGGGGYNVTIDEVGRLCFNGGKPGFSYDEKWMIIHHYIQDSDATDLGFASASDPGFAAYRTQGAANLYLVNLATGEKTRITRMAPGQYALFPHFRNDGWIYFNVRNAGSSTEYIVASDAALFLDGL